MELHELLLQITRCPELILAGMDGEHPCAKVAAAQPAHTYQVVEPWLGHIDKAPILFISRSPRVGEDSYTPRLDWSDHYTASFFQRHFENDAGWTRVSSNGVVRRITFDRNGRRVPGKGMQFYGHLRNRAGELLESPAVSGRDFALAPAVHCRTPNGEGVPEALSRCAETWMDLVLEHAAALIVVLLGLEAQEAATSVWGLDASRTVQFDVPIAGRNRAVARLPLPGAGEVSTFEKCVDADDLRRLRALLSANKTTPIAAPKLAATASS